MVTRVEKILSNARLTLADPKKQRWDDPTLIAILNEGLIDFSQQTEMLHERANVPIIIGNPYFSLPDDCWMLTRVLYDNSPLPIVSHLELDSATYSRGLRDFGSPTGGSRWETAVGEPNAIIYDRRNILEGKIYPIPGNIFNTIEDIFGVVSSNSTDTFGVTTSADNLEVQPIYGIATDITYFLTCYYLKNPGELKDVTDVIDTPAMYDIALKFYVVGQALMNDLDAAYQQKGAAQMMIYERHVKNANKSSMRDFTRAAQFHTIYRNGF